MECLDDIVLFWCVRKGCDWSVFVRVILIGSRRGLVYNCKESVWPGSGIGDFRFLLRSFLGEGGSGHWLRRDPHDLSRSAHEGGGRETHFRALF